MTDLFTTTDTVWQIVSETCTWIVYEMPTSIPKKLQESLQ